MRIAFDAKRIFHNQTGLGNYGRTLLDNLYLYYPNNDYLLYTPHLSTDNANKNYEEKFQTIIANTTFKHIWRSYSIRKDLERDEATLYHGLSNEIPFWLKNTKTVVTIHDVIFKLLPHTYPQLDRFLYEEKTRYACKHADKIIAISENTKEDLIRFYEVEAQKIEVIYQACQPIFYQETALKPLSFFPDLKNLPAEFILYVGSIVERKNLLTLVKALDQLPDNQKIPLVIVGNGKAYKKKVQKFVTQKKLGKWIYWLENLTALPALKLLYQKAQVLAYPSVCEGFGLPVAEAKLCGTPVITSNTSALPEAAGKYAKLVPPTDIDAWCNALTNLLNNSQLNHELGENGQKEALKTFNPQKLTKAVVKTYQSLITP